MSSGVLAGEDLRAAIQARENEWAAAFAAKDVAGVAAIYEEDAVLLPPGMEPANGRAAIAAVLEKIMPAFADLALIADDVRPLGDGYAVEIGHSTYQAIGADGSKTPGSDNYVVVWHKGADGVWRYVSDIFNQR
jgi:uncharacterized protein (TIGR02246 family)